MPCYPGFLGESSGRLRLSLFYLRTRTSFSFINKMDIVYHDNAQLPPSDGYLEGYYSEKLSRVLRGALRLVYLNPFVLLNSHTDPAEPLDGTGVYPNTLSTNTTTSIAVTSLPRIASNVMVSWRSPRPKADSCSLISTTGGCEVRCQHLISRIPRIRLTRSLLPTSPRHQRFKYSSRQAKLGA